MADLVSAVDDTFNLTPQAGCAAEASDNDIMNDAYNTPHQGNWEVASGIESFVDAHCATVHGYRPSYTQAKSGLAIDQGLTKRFMQATFEEKRAKVLVQQDNDRKKSVNDKARASSTSHPERKPKAFVVPPLHHKSVSSPGHSIKLKAKPASVIATKEQNPEMPAQPRNLVPSTIRPKQSIPPGRNSQSQSRDRIVQIVAKNGEQALVRLPLITSLSSGTEAWPDKKQASHGRTVSTIASAVKAHSRHSGSQAAPAVKESSDKNLDKPRSAGQGKKQVPVIIDTLMEKLPPQSSVAPDLNKSKELDKVAQSSHKSSRGPDSEPGSCKDSGIAMSIGSKVRSKAGSGISQAAFSIAEKIAHSNCTAKAPVGAATAPSTSNLGSKRGTPLAIQQALHQQTSIAANGSQASAILPQNSGSKVGTLRSNYKPPTVRSGSSSTSVIHSFRGFRQDVNGNRAKNQDELHQISRASKASSPGVHKHSASILESNRSTTSPLNKSKSSAESKSTSALPLAISLKSLASGQRKTNFAGDGWISPHPLSVASIDVGASPQAAVKLSTDALGQSGTLTYEEWKARRYDVVSIPGSYAPSHVPSAVRSQTVPLAHNRQPPADYAGSHPGMVPRDSQRSPKAHSRASRSTQRHASASKNSAACSPDSLQQRTHSDFQGVTSNMKGSIYKASSVLSQNAGWSSPFESHGSGSGNPAPYTVGITSTELGDYQRRLGSIVSRYSSHLSLLQAEQASPQPDYDMWNSRQSLASKPSLPQYSAHQSYHSDFTVSNNQGFGAQSEFGPYRTTSLSGPTDPEWLQPEDLISGSQHSAHAPGPLVVSDPYGDNVAFSPRIPICPPSAVQVSPSQVTYGTNEWQDLENAEEGRGRYEISKMW